jgi:hypothetical protein
LIAILLGIRNGLADVQAGRPPYLSGVLFHRDHRGELARTGFERVVNLLLMGILLDAIFPWVILGVSHPGAALVVGPVLIVAPYALARALEPPRGPACAGPTLTRATRSIQCWKRHSERWSWPPTRRHCLNDFPWTPAP